MQIQIYWMIDTDTFNSPVLDAGGRGEKHVHFQKVESDGHLSGQLAQAPQDRGQEEALPQEAEVWAGTPRGQH